MIPLEDEYNRALLQNVHPPGWVNPTPNGRYHLAVVGAGTAGLVTAAVAAALGAKVALIENRLMGGDCLNVGCVPSKGILGASRVWSRMKEGPAFGIDPREGVRRDFPAVMARMRRLRALLSRNDSAQRFKKMGVDVYIGEGRFIGPETLEVDGKRLTFSKAAVCTGTRPAVPPFPGLEEAGYLTNETVFNLTALPARLAVIGGGPIGCELGQAFARFGSRVTLFERQDRILPREEKDAAGIIQARMEREGVRFSLNTTIGEIKRLQDGTAVSYETPQGGGEGRFDAILVAVGRRPTVEGIGLEAAGVEYDPNGGVRVNEKLQTTNRRIYAAGDVCFPHQFTHAADALAQIVVQNALFPHPFGLGTATTDDLVLPRCTYTEPELAHVGLTDAEARARGIPIESFTIPMNEVDRALLDGEEEGFARMHVKKGTDRIVGATLVAAHAGDLIGEITLAIKAKKGLKTLAATIHPYPTQAEVIKKVAIAWRKTTLTEGKRALLRRWFSLMK